MLRSSLTCVKTAFLTSTLMSLCSRFFLLVTIYLHTYLIFVSGIPGVRQKNRVESIAHRASRDEFKPQETGRDEFKPHRFESKTWKYLEKKCRKQKLVEPLRPASIHQILLQPKVNQGNTSILRQDLRAKSSLCSPLHSIFSLR